MRHHLWSCRLCLGNHCCRDFGPPQVQIAQSSHLSIWDQRSEVAVNRDGRFHGLPCTILHVLNERQQEDQEGVHALDVYQAGGSVHQCGRLPADHFRAVQLTLQRHPLVFFFRGALGEKLLSLHFDDVLEVVQLVVDAISLRFSAAFNFQFDASQSIQQLLSSLGVKTQAFLPLCKGPFASVIGLVDGLLVVAFMAPQDEAMRANRLLAIVAIEAELFIWVVIAKHALGNLVDADLAILGFVQVHHEVIFENTF
mmetsp:Transcript_79491/g.165048  ORF Transcript_79491/g.165048 Transcript_79491/m.165048 type:complete len:254 (-) Transcript_79491:370-1131(-)